MLVTNEQTPAVASAYGLSLLVVIWVAFFAFGLLFGALGPSFQELAEHTGSSLTDIGLISSLSFVGGLLVQAVAGALVDRLGPLPLLIVSAVLIGLGTLGITTGTVLVVVLAVAFVAGSGHGLLDTSGQIVAATAFPNNAVRALNSVHLSFAVGVVVGPAVASFTLSQWQTAIPAMWLGAALFIAITPVLWWMNRRVSFTKPSQTETVNPEVRPAVAASLYRSPLLWAFGLIILFYVGVETGMGNWTPTYLQQSVNYSPADAALATSWYWAAFMLSRLLATIIGGRIKPHTMMMGVLVGTLFGAGLLIAGAGNGFLTIVGTCIMGFFFGPVYPTVMSLATSTFTHAPGKSASVVVAMGSIGGMVIPWLHGAGIEEISTSWHVFYAMAMSLAMLGAYLAARYFYQARQQIALSQHVAVGGD